MAETEPVRMKKSDEGFEEMEELVRLNHLAHNPHLQPPEQMDVGEAEVKAIKQTIKDHWEDYTR
jgi:hypothetical protein